MVAVRSYRLTIVHFTRATSDPLLTLSENHQNLTVTNRDKKTVLLLCYTDLHEGQQTAKN